MLNLLPERIDNLLLLGAHCDDIAIGAGGTLLELTRAQPETRVTALVFTGGGGPREHEERSALAALCQGAPLKVEVLDLPDGHLPTRWECTKRALANMREQVSPDLILGPSQHDAHQDHRTVAQLVPTVFRDHLALGYEILKWDGDLAQPQAYVPLTEPVLRAKIDVLYEHYRSQHGRTWFNADTFAGLAHIRGVQCHARFAEAFHLSKLVIGLRAPTDFESDTAQVPDVDSSVERNPL